MLADCCPPFRPGASPYLALTREKMKTPPNALPPAERPRLPGQDH